MKWDINGPKLVSFVDVVPSFGRGSNPRLKTKITVAKLSFCTSEGIYMLNDPPAKLYC